ncbi:ATP-binding protein [Nocardia sp. alder85J]|uniref:ATP-binding protein n=1 Tax=Nocardia sp. alder85J TaxID=2862949 RepID=UPI001CD4F95D|nr:helicase HerA-like domain-containing protein [Nocardia sp. alder85J]MCX4092347.1 DUF853 family protein [Nocardia sp. alder85J]
MIDDLPLLAPRLTLAQATQFGMNLPDILIALLERRYLHDFEPRTWNLDIAADNVPPQLCEIVGMAKEKPGEDWTRAMPHMLTGTHGQGHAMITVSYGTADRHRIFVGGRRLPDGSLESTEEFLDGQSGALRAHIPGLVLTPPAVLGDTASLELADFLRTAPATAVMTGVPSIRAGADSSVFQNIDRLAAAAAGRQYALVVVAEPLPATALDETLDRCRKLRSEIHTLVRRTVSHAEGSGSSTGTTTPERQRAGEVAVPLALAGLAAFCGIAGSLPMPAMTALMGMASTANLVFREPRTSVTETASTNRTDSETTDLLDAGAEACEELLTHHSVRLQAARSSGWWRTSIYLFADSAATAAAVAGAVRGIASGTSTFLDPMRVVPVPAHLVRSAATRGRSIALHPATRGIGHPLGPAFDALATCMTSDELAILVTPPRREIPGLPRREIGEFALTAAPPTDSSIVLGALQDPAGRSLGPVTLTSQALNRHVLIAGMTGYGKTTTAQRLLLESYTELGLPFLVIEPVKAEYRRLREHPRLQDRLRVFTIGVDDGRPLRLNPFEPQPGVPLLRHIDLLKAVFNASFPMFAGMSYVLEEAMLDIYTERGWNLHTSQNDYLDRSAGPMERYALLPSMTDLHDKIEQVLEGRQYGREVHQNLGAALRSRLRSLMVGAKGMTLDTTRSVPIDELFEAPCVIELRNLGDDEEKAFVMALLLSRLYEFAEAGRQHRSPAAGEQLRHLTLIEEAHRLLRAPRAAGGPESPDAQAKAVTLFTDMLAEMRSYGEGFIVADQIPTKLAPDILKNSNIKILHRLAAPDDRAVVAAATNLDQNQNRHLAGLHPGEAVVHDDRIGSAVLVRVTPLPSATGTVRVPVIDLGYLHRNSACARCPAPCTLLEPGRRAQAEDDTDRQLWPAFRAILLGDRETAWQAWDTWRRPWRTGNSDGYSPVAYCAASQSAHRWSTRAAADRRDALGGGGRAAVLLDAERVAATLGRLCSEWLSAEDNSASFEAAHRDLTALLASTPPRELPGCARCPARCRMLVLIAELPAATRRAVAHRAGAALSMDARVRSIDEALGPLPTALADDRHRIAYRYCAVTTANTGSAELLEHLLVVDADRPEPA